MADPTSGLKELRPEHEFFIGIDSDGCVFDSMEIKQKECFTPNSILHYGLQPVSSYARDVLLFVNLYSTTRGINRFKAITRSLDLLARRPEVVDRGAVIPDLKALKAWCGRESQLGNPALKEEAERTRDPELEAVYAWSIDVNETIEKIVKNVPPFAWVRDSLAKMREKADLIVVSQTPLEALQREWREHGIDGYVRVIAGQEMGTKSEHIACAGGGKYPKEKMLMIGDAPGDLAAGRDNGTLFYPIVPGHEDESWKRFLEEALDRFLAGAYAGAYEKSLLDEFNRCLPEEPSWEQLPEGKGARRGPAPREV